MVRTFEIAGPNGHLGAVTQTASNVEKYRADFSYFLEQGVILTNITVEDEIINDDAIVNNIALSSDCKAVIWHLESTDSPAVFEFNFTVTTNDGQTLNYTVQYNVGQSEL